MDEMPYAAGLGPRSADGVRVAGWVVFGAGGHARSVVDVLERLGESVVAVVGEAGGRAWHVDVLADEEEALERVVREGLRAAVAIGAPEPRLALLPRLGAQPSESSVQNVPARSAHSSEGGPARSAHSSEGGPDVSSRVQFAPAVVAVSATVAPDVQLGAGSVVLEHAHVGPAARLGAGVIVNTGAIVEHDCVVGDGGHIAPGAVLLGSASVGAACLVGSGARILPGVTVGSDVTIGAGAVVTRDVPDGVTITGVPARAESVHR
ncbi:DapH/DapD/GlmU-related protein [Intrasporangium sp.]|uniref:PglD-related sugar-binding protein n=1 Tax=Intrasporangium sp. TaxID=1925024 RepID=UPI003365740E